MYVLLTCDSFSLTIHVILDLICFSFNAKLGFIFRVNNMNFDNDCASLKFHKQSFKGVVVDYIISFKEEQTSIQDTLLITRDLFRQLIESFNDKNVSARLIAKVNFIHVNAETNEMEERPYHFTSYKSERVFDIDDFFTHHMMKIASRLDSFNRNGSSLLIKNIEHLHVCISKV